MLARANRIVQADDYKKVVRRGLRNVSRNTVVYIVHRIDMAGPRFGFIVAKTVGNAVARNLVRRRLKSVSRSLLDSLPGDTDVVIRALPGSQDTAWTVLRDEIRESIAKDGRS